ncbi:hypothetical protein [Planococcus sp. ISL-109]|uniref:hypothetical protein n=1 Tax=Planococcus sp. ISL-109 TaxID=2819166 RepID=UPI001BED0CD0|nr:hypothetical protein [Planococcus sp. ISL-109]MBT2582718.1 hypothetical protein [Planococcus sp. ISL-109]
MKPIRSISAGQIIVLLSMATVIALSIAFAAQSLFSYLEVTQAADQCYDLGGLPVIEKSGWRMTHFECNTD